MNLGKLLPRVSKALAVLVLAAALALGTGATTAYAKTLKSSGVKFTTKNKTVSTKMWYAGAGKQNMTYKISNVKVKNAKKKGYKTATFTITVNRKWAPTKAQVRKMVDNLTADNLITSGHYSSFVVDYKTGDNLLVPAVAKKHGVTVKEGKWTHTKTKRYYAADGAYVYLYGKSTLKVTVTYPKGYKGLCVGVGCGQKEYDAKQMAKWESGKVSYTKCWWHKNNASSTRFIRIK